jgi:hypothetical protein
VSGPDDQTEGVWVTADPLPNGKYEIVVSVDGDRSWSLSRGRARLHGLVAITIAERACYEQAIYGHCINQLGLPQDVALHILSLFRTKLPPVDHAATDPLRFVNGINERGEAFIVIHLDQNQIGQISPSVLRSHGVALLQVRATSDLDEIYRRLMVEEIEVDDGRAKAAVNDLAKHRPDDQGWDFGS